MLVLLFVLKIKCTFQSVRTCVCTHMQACTTAEDVILLIVRTTHTVHTVYTTQTVCTYTSSIPVNTACWQQDPHTRPDFATVLAKLQELQLSKFASIELEAFTTLQQSWKEEVRLKFEEFKKKEEVSD